MSNIHADIFKARVDLEGMKGDFPGLHLSGIEDIIENLRKLEVILVIY